MKGHICMKIKQLFLCVAACIILTGCSGNPGVEMTDPSTITAEVLYLYDVRNGAIRAGEQSSDSGEDGFWLPVSDNIYAEFQDPEVVGAWSPEQYFGSKQLEKGFRNGRIAVDSRFTWFVGSDGSLNSLYQENYYENNNVTN